MRSILENLLLHEDVNIYNQYKVLVEILNFISKKINFVIDDNKILKILDSYIKNNWENVKAKDFIDELILFLRQIINLYLNGKIERFNFVLEENKTLNPQLKISLKENKEEIIDVCSYYYKDILLESREEIFNNDYFSLIKVTKSKSDDCFVITSNPEDTLIRILLKGKIYYKSGVFFKEGEYLITGPKTNLGKCKVISDEFLMLVITIKKEFIDTFKVKEINKIIQVPSTIRQQDYMKLLDKEEFFLFLDILILILRGNGLIGDDNYSFVEVFLKKELDICNLIDTIDENIKLPEEEIKNILMTFFKATEKKLDEFMYESHKMTLKKYILKRKIKYIVEEYLMFPKISLEQLLEKYSYSNYKNFRYNLKNFYDLSIKDCIRTM